MLFYLRTIIMNEIWSESFEKKLSRKEKKEVKKNPNIEKTEDAIKLKKIEKLRKLREKRLKEIQDKELIQEIDSNEILNSIE